MLDFKPFIIRLIAALSAGLVAASGASAAGAAAEGASDLRLKLTTIMDPSGFEKPMPAARTVIPADWTTEGGVIWRLGADCNTGQTVNWSASSPDGKATIRLLPAASWRYNNQGGPTGQGCIPGAFNSAEDYVRNFIRPLKNARIVSVERDPTTSQFLAQQPFSYELPGDPYMKVWWDAASVTFTFDDEGTNYTGTLMLFTMHSHMVSGHSYGWGPALETGYGMAPIQILFGAPTDEFMKYTPAFQLFAENYRTDPDWQARMDRYNAQMSRDAIKTSKNISKIISDTYSEISDMNMKSWEKQNESFNTTSRETSEWVRGVETYDADTPTGQIELPSGYDRAFQLTDDTFVVTNDAFYEPFRDAGIDGRELTATR